MSSSPSKPVGIRSRLAVSDPAIGTPSLSATPHQGSPGLRALRAQFGVAGTPPNIPPRATTPLPAKDASPGGSPFPPRNIPLPSSSSQPSGISASRTPGTPGSGTESPSLPDLDDLPEEEKLKVLRRHLVSKDERNQSGDIPSVTTRPNSHHSSSGEGASHAEESEPFPIPFHAHGADVTCVLSFGYL